MKKIFFLLLVSLSCLAQNPTRFEKIKITANAVDNSATKISVQSSTNEINWITKANLIGDVLASMPSLSLSYSAPARQLTLTPYNSIVLPLVGANDGLMSSADKTKLDALNSADYVPITGTDLGVPLTGDLEFNAGYIEYSLYKTNIDEDWRGRISLSDALIQISSSDFNVTNDNSISIYKDVTEFKKPISIQDANSLSKGITSSYDYSANITNLDYTQKIYVDTKADSKVADNLTASTTVAPSKSAVNTALSTKQDNITLTTTGTSGVATLVGNTLNIPNYASGGGATNLTYTPSATNGIVNSDTGTDATIPLANGTDAGLSLNDYTTAEKSKLAGVATGATANSSDATLLDRANHTGTQTASTISDFNTSVLNLTLAKSKAVYQWALTTATGGLWIGTAGAGAGTYTTALPTDTNLYTSTKRARYANVVTTTNQVLGQRNTEAIFYRGSVVSGAGGFKFFARGGFDVWTNGSRFFAGMASGTTVISADPSLLANTVGFGVDASDNGLIYFITRNASTVTRVSTGLTIVSNKGYDFNITCVAGGSSYDWSITDLNTGTTASGTATLTLPVNNTKLTVNFLASNGALTPVTSTQLGLCKMTIETDY